MEDSNEIPITIPVIKINANLNQRSSRGAATRLEITVAKMVGSERIFSAIHFSRLVANQWDQQKTPYPKKKRFEPFEHKPLLSITVRKILGEVVDLSNSGDDGILGFAGRGDHTPGLVSCYFLYVRGRSLFRELN